ncbi:MAG: FHA domain-containing protein [Ruminiclostridium sp.]|nr:FHA domain-containing protein [Ruminiclostridium sp.]
MAEINQKIVRCDRCNQFYDVFSFTSCPYCSGIAPQQANPGYGYAPPAPGNGSFSRTVDPYSGGTGNFSKTIDPYASSSQAGSFSPTIDPDAPKAGSFSRTIAPEGAQANREMSETVYVDEGVPNGSGSPVVGWIVVINGNDCIGKDFRIHTGYNSIGRKSGDIVITGDNSISGEKDSMIVYEPDTKQFYISHDSGKNVLSVNHEPVIGGSVELHPYDLIRVGKTELVFIPLCGKRFSWKEGLANG